MGCGISKVDPEEAGGSSTARGFKPLPKRHSTYPAAAATNNFSPKPAELDDGESLDLINFDRKSVSSTAMGGGDDEGVGGIVLRENKVRDGDCCTEDYSGSISDRDDSIACPASPSFREYCVSNVSRNESNSKNIEGRTRSAAKVENMSHGEEPLHKVQRQKTKATKKKSQESRRSGIVRNLFHNVACYNPTGRSIPHDNHHKQPPLRRSDN